MKRRLTTLPITFTTPGTGPAYEALGDRATILLSGLDTGGAFTMLELVVPPGGGPPPHCHSREDEWFYILEGHAELWQNGLWQDVPAGTAIFLPRCVPHTFRNCGDTPLRMIVQAAPAGFDDFFKEIAGICARSGAPDMQAITETATRFGISFILPEE